MNERIAYAAARIDTESVFTAFDHRSAFIEAQERGLVTEDDFLGPRHEEGFVTNLGRWLGRDEAFVFAKLNGQAKNPTNDYLDAMEVRYR